ncbi:MAG: hypothetical protein E7446_06825 [Ruminococcaceae bacterium]|nr:hypothetical protein [Oscillospiraceae bacterium]
MKKLPGILLAMMLCVAPVSCGQGGPNVPEPQEINAIFDDQGVNITCLIRISINPEFELIVDDQGTVCDVIRLNDDAEKVFAQANDIVMKSYDAAVAELLAAAKNSGYMTGKSDVSVTVILREDCAFGDAVISAVDETVQEFVSAKRCDMEVWDGREKSDQTQNNDGGNTGDENNGGGDGQTTNGVEVRDANGKLISRTTESKTPDGIMTITEYFDANENRIKEVQEGNGTTMIAEYDASGQRISLVQDATNPEGVRETRNSTFSYDENGNVTVEYTHVSDGRYIETHYYANGSAASCYIQTADGGYVDDTYDENGNLISRKRKFVHDSGAYGLWTDFLDGTSEEYFYDIDGSVWYSWFDAEGHQHGPTRVQ